MRVVLCPAAVPSASRNSAATEMKIRKNRERIRVNQVAPSPRPRETGEVSPDLRPGSSLVTALLKLSELRPAPREAIVNGELPPEAINIRCTLRATMRRQLAYFVRKWSAKSPADGGVEWLAGHGQRPGYYRRTETRVIMRLCHCWIQCLSRDTPPQSRVRNENRSGHCGFRFGPYLALQFARPGSQFIVHYPGQRSYEAAFVRLRAFGCRGGLTRRCRVGGSGDLARFASACIPPPRKFAPSMSFASPTRPLPASLNTGFETVSSPAVFLQAARFQDHLYLAGPAGLQEYTPEGSLLHQYAVGSELPGSPLVALAPAVLADSREPELIVATANDGLLAFNGRAFRQILPASADARAITAILPVASGHLLDRNQEARRPGLRRKADHAFSTPRSNVST